VVPDYEGYCFANVPGTVGDVLGVDVGRSLPTDALAGVETDVSHVVVVVLDSLGWHRFHRDAADHRFLSRLVDRAPVTPLTSVLPSSTASAVTTAHTGATPAEHGVFGWDVRLPDHDTVVEAFLHECRDDEGTPPVSSDELVRASPVYPAFEAASIESRVVQPAETLHTAYADATFRGANQVAYDGATVLRERLEASASPSYTYFYAGDIDTRSHDYGTDSAAYHDALASVTTGLSRALYDDLDAETAAETLLMVTADHGQIDLESGPAGCIDVLSVEGVADALARGPAGDPVYPWGDHRLLHLAVQDGKRSRARTALASRGVTVFSREQVHELGLYGSATSPAFDRRCGDLVCTHPDRKLISPANEKALPKIGMHGGPTAREMLVPFAAARLSELR
jgi:predicted AlkP superfamily pyrophosphatase or phosphodiesterase